MLMWSPDKHRMVQSGLVSLGKNRCRMEKVNTLLGQYSPPAMNNADTRLFILHVNTEAASDCDSPHWAGGMGSLVGAELSYQWLQHALSFFLCYTHTSGI